jgi:hypothetical protein
MKGTPWTPAEVEKLCSMTGDMPWQMVPACYNDWAIEHGYPERSAEAMRGRVERSGVPRQTSGSWVRSDAIAGTLGVSTQTVMRWTQMGLKSQSFGTGLRARYFMREWIRQFAKRRPDLFAGFPESALFQILENEKMAADLASRERPQWVTCKPVICVETGQQYPTIRAAARAAYVTNERMSKVVRRGGTANGKHWRAA